MAIVNSEVLGALVSAGADHTRASEAAEHIYSLEKRIEVFETAVRVVKDVGRVLFFSVLGGLSIVTVSHMFFH